jgi:hypothetical protein
MLLLMAFPRLPLQLTLITDINVVAVIVVFKNHY